MLNRVLCGAALVAVLVGAPDARPQTGPVSPLATAEAILREAQGPAPADLRVSPLDLPAEKPGYAAFRVKITWNTPTDVDLWVTEPGGQKCWYQAVKTANGGSITPDDTKGFGPEVYAIAKGPPGEYVIEINMYAIRSSGATSVTTEITQYPGTPQQKVQQFTNVLTQNGQTITVTRLKF